jgi:membrane fusion protein (multidrug efflux system)
MINIKKLRDSLIHIKKLSHFDGEKRRISLILLGPTFIILVVAYFYFTAERYITTDNAYLKADKVSIAAEVSGRLKQIFIKDNEVVHKGQLLFTIEEEPFVIAVQQAKAQLAQTANKLLSTKASYQQKIAAMEANAANLKYLEDEYYRSKKLLGKDFIATARYQQAESAWLSTQKSLKALQYEVEAEKAMLDGKPDLELKEYASYQQSLASLEKAKLDLKRIMVTAPFDGVAANVKLNPGAYILTGMSLFNVVKNNGLWIEANFKETDLTHVQPGQKATVEIDTYPGKKWTATVISITPATGSEFSVLPAQNSSGNWVKVVQRIMVRSEFDKKASSSLLAAGMSANITIDTGYNRLARFFQRQLTRK